MASEIAGTRGTSKPDRMKADSQTLTVTVLDRRAIAAQQLVAELALREIRVAFDGRILLLKGLELACRYADPTDRPFGDLDLLTDEPERLQATLLASGYDYDDAIGTDTDLPYRDPTFHQLAPLRHATLPVIVEVHRNPGWLAGMAPPQLSELIDRATPSRSGVDGLLTLDPAAHAVYLAVHSWRHRPFYRRQDLEDIQVLLEHDGTKTEAADLARAWGVGRIWGYYQNAIEARLGNEPARPMVRLLGGTADSESRSVRSEYLGQYAGRFFVDHPIRHRAAIVRGIRGGLQPLEGERFRQKLARMIQRLT